MPYLVITLATLIFWHPILKQTFLGESYYYFDKIWSLIASPKPIYYIPTYYDVFSRFFFDITIPIFKDNIAAFMVVQLILMLILYFTVYYFLSRVTASKAIALIATVFFLTNYMYSFDVWGIANYARITQRIPNLIPHLISFVYLSDHFRNATKPKGPRVSRNLKVSWLLFGLAIFMGHYSTFLTPIFIVFPIVFVLIKSPKLIKHGLLVATAFAAINFALISLDPHTSDRSTSTLFKREAASEVLAQVSHLTIPPGVFKALGFKYPYTSPAVGFAVPILVLLSVGYLYIKKRSLNSNLRVIYLTFLVSIPIMLVFNLLAARNAPLTHANSDRYYFIPGILSATLIAALSWTVVRQFKYARLALTLLALMYLSHNYLLIKQNFEGDYHKSLAMKAYLAHIKTVDFNKDVVLAAPTSFMWPNQMIERLYAKSSYKFVDTENVNWQDTISKDEVDSTYVINYEPYAVGSGSYGGKIIDLTDKFRENY